MITSVSPLIIGAAAFFIIGGAWMVFYFRVVEPWLRRVIGRMIGATINRGEHQIWIVNEESEDSLSWQTMVIRPLQMVFMMGAGMFALLIGLAVTLWLSQ